MSDQRTIDVYNARVDAYVETVAHEPDNETIAAFIAALPAKGRVLDIGCATANAAAKMRDAGLQIVAVDPSEGMIAKAKQLHDINVIPGSFDDIPALGKFDGIWANFCLLHARREDMPRHLGDIHAALTPGGLFHIALKLGDGDARDRIDRYYTYYAEDELTALLENAGFGLVDKVYGEGPGLEGSISKWIAIRARTEPRG